jgi:L-amino acid N-acyltransferase YncA
VSRERINVAVRPARPHDAEQVARIYHEGIEDRVATFQTRPAQPVELAAEISAGGLIVVAEAAGGVVGWAKVGAYDQAHEYYAGVGEATLYVARNARRGGAGRALLNAVAKEAEKRGCHKLVGKIFTSNGPSIGLVRSCGWREVGVHRRHGRLDGEWKDVLVVERLLGEALEDLGPPTKRGSAIHGATTAVLALPN